MDVETVSTNTSVDDKTEDFCENPTRDTLAEGLMCLLKPTIDQLDERVRATRQVLIFLFCVMMICAAIHNMLCRQRSLIHGYCVKFRICVQLYAHILIMFDPIFVNTWNILMR